MEAFRSERKSERTAERPTGEFAAFQRSKSEILLLPDGYHSIPVELGGGGGGGSQRFEVINFSPVWRIPHGARFAAIGLQDMMNPEGAVKDMRAFSAGCGGGGTRERALRLLCRPSAPLHFVRSTTV